MQPPTGYGAMAPSYGASSGGTYEFNDAENLTIATVARYARIWGIISLLSGIAVLGLGFVVALMGGAIAAAAASRGSGTGAGSPLASSAAVAAIGVALVPSGIVSIVGGIFYMRSGSSLQSVVDSQGNDIPLLNQAIRSLSLAFKIEAIAMAVGFVIGLVIGVVGRVGGE
ncbi:MAG: hypothetical protein JST00_03950 [Deltaproteobacteria bacterium]|nr:hypothetical protein [Deltaproteobacteria bacterium]